MATFSVTRTSGGNPPGNLKYRSITYDRSPRVLVSSHPKRYRLQLRQNSLELWSENIDPKQYWASQCGNSFIKVRSSETFGYSKVYARAYAKFRDEVWAGSKAALAVEIGERKETFSMITEALGTLAKAMNQVRRGQFKGASKTLKLYVSPKGTSMSDTFLNNWMRYRYGFIPVISSLHGWAELVERPSFVYGKGVSRLPFAISGWNSQFWRTTSEVYGTTQVTIKGRCTIASPTLVKMRDLGLVNPASVAYELVTASFVLDWFVGFGDWIDSYTDFVGLQFDDCAVTTTIKGTEFLHATAVNDMGPGKVVYPGLWVVIDTLWKYRHKIGAPPAPGLQLGTGLNVKRAIDSVALLKNLLRRK